MNLKNPSWNLPFFFFCFLVSICESICWFHRKNSSLLLIFALMSPKRRKYSAFHRCYFHQFAFAVFVVYSSPTEGFHLVQHNARVPLVRTCNIQWQESLFLSALIKMLRLVNFTWRILGTSVHNGSYFILHFSSKIIANVYVNYREVLHQ